MKKTGLLLLVIWVAPLLSCSSIPVSTNYDKSANFTNLQTYAWTASSEQKDKDRLKDPSALSQIQTAIDRKLALNGYQIVTENPDFLLASHTSVVDRSFTLQPYSSGSVSRPSRYQESTVVIEIFDPGTRKRIWWGNARMVAGLDDDPETKAKQVNEVVQKILEEFPPKRNT